MFHYKTKAYSEITERRLNYLFISNSLQKTISNVDILNASSTDRFLIFCSFIKFEFVRKVRVFGNLTICLFVALIL